MFDELFDANVSFLPGRAAQRTVGDPEGDGWRIASGTSPASAHGQWEVQ
jgi:hypothetical protein